MCVCVCLSKISVINEPVVGLSEGVFVAVFLLLTLRSASLESGFCTGSFESTAGNMDYCEFPLQY